MGRITVFTSHDTNSFAVLEALKKRSLPYSEISLIDHPSRAADLKALSGHLSVPRVFFNTRHVGGVDETLQELLRWDHSEMYKSPLERYNAEILQRHDPANPKLALPEDVPKVSSSAKAQPGAAPQVSIKLPDGTATTFHDITEKLRNTLAIADVTHRGTVYKRAFTGSHAVKTFETSLGATRSAALAFADALLQQSVMVRVSPSNSFRIKTATFEDSGSAVYRLQCHSEPNVLNSYLVWRQEVRGNPVEVLATLDTLLQRIEIDSASTDGLLDLGKALNHSQFPVFEEMVCELQKISFSALPLQEKLPFALNLYNLMIRYAFVKVGIPISDADRLHFMNSVKFNVGGHMFSLNDWVNGVLRGNAKSPGGKVPFGRNDARQAFVWKPRRSVDARIHYAINVGPHLGSRAGLPFERFTSANIEKELDIAGFVFWEDDANLEVVKGEIKIPKVLAWHKADFSDTRDLSRVVETLAEHMLIGQIRNIQAALASKHKVTLVDANWARNARNFARYDKLALVAEQKGLKASLVRRFQTPRIPENESLRLAALRGLNILDSLPDERFDRLTRMVQDEFAAAMVFCNFVDQKRTWVKSTTAKGGPKEMPRDITLCGHVILEQDVMVVPDLLQDDRFAENPAVQATGLRFYAGAPLSVSAPQHNGEEDVNVGTLCVVDTKPRHFTEKDKETLRSYAHQIQSELLSNKGGKGEAKLRALQAMDCQCA